MFSFATLDEILWRFTRGVMHVPFDFHVGSDLLDDDSANLTGLGIPSYVLTDLECFRHRGHPVLLLCFCVSDGCKQCVGILPRVESSVLYDNWHVGLDDACVVGPSRNWLGIL